MAPVRLPPVFTLNVSSPAPPVRVPNPPNARSWPPTFTSPLSGPLMSQVTAPANPLVSVLASFAVMLSMLVKFVAPLVEVPLYPFAPDAVRFTVAAPRPLVSMLSDPVPPLTLLSAPVPVNVKLSPLLSPFRVLKLVNPNPNVLLVRLPAFAAVMLQAVAPAARLLVRVPPSALLKISTAVTYAGPAVEEPVSLLTRRSADLTVAAPRPLVSMLSDPVPPLTLLSAPVPVNVKLSPLLSPF